MHAHELIRQARQTAGLSQTELARRLNTTQSAIARLEAAGSNPRLGTVTKALAACRHELVLDARRRPSSIDETLVARMLRVSPGQRIKHFERAYAETRKLALAGDRARAGLA